MPKTAKTVSETETSCGTSKTGQDTPGAINASPRFLSLIRHIDASGYIFDTLRYTPPQEHYGIIRQDGYVMFEISKESTQPFMWPIWSEEHVK